MAKQGVWVAYHPDWSGVVLFASEVAALRHAVAHSMSAAFVAYGVELREGVKAQQPEVSTRRRSASQVPVAEGGDAS